MISLLVPTRGRPENMRRLVNSARDTADYPVPVVFYIDEDDTASAQEADDLCCDSVVGPRIVLSQMWNECYRLSTTDINMHCGDDIVFQTPSWDRIVEEMFDQFPDKIALVYGDDGFQGEQLATHSFQHRNWTDTLGYFVPPYFSSDYNDTWLTDVATMIGRKIYLPQVVTEHMHPAANKGTWDSTHQERLARHERDNVGALYESLLSKREDDARKLQEFIERF